MLYVLVVLIKGDAFDRNYNFVLTWKSAMACKLSALFSIGEDFDDEDLLGTDWCVRTSSSKPGELAAAVSSSLLQASSVSHREAEKSRPQDIGECSSVLRKGTASGNNSRNTAGQTVTLSLRQISNSPSYPLGKARSNSPEIKKISNTTELLIPRVGQDDFDDWDIDLADLDEPDSLIGRPLKSIAPPVNTVAGSFDKIMQPIIATTPLNGGERLQNASYYNQIPNGLRSITGHSSSSNERSFSKLAVPSGISKLSHFAFNHNQTPRASPVQQSPVAKSTPFQPPTSVQSPRPAAVASPSLGVFPVHTTVSPCARRIPEQRHRPLSTQVASRSGCGLFESLSPGPSLRPTTPLSLRTPVLTNRLVQLVSVSNSKKRPRSESSRVRTRRFPGPAGLLPQQPQGQSLDDIVVSVPNTPAHGAVARSPSQCSSSQTEEEDFSGPAWTALKSEMGLDERNPSCFLHTNSVVMVLRKAALKQLVKNKVPNMAVLLKSIVPTHTDAKAVFRDPTGEMQGTVHRRLLEDRAGELKAGAVLLLKQVGVFSPSHRNHYLNVTPNNLLRIYSPDGASMSSTQLSSLALEPVLLSSTPGVLRGPVSKMQLLFDEDDDCSQDQEWAAARGLQQRAPVDQSFSTGHQKSLADGQDAGWGADDLDELMGDLPEDTYSA